MSMDDITNTLKKVLCNGSYTLPDDKILDRSKFKAFADDVTNEAEIKEFVLVRVGNVVGNELVGCIEI